LGDFGNYVVNLHRVGDFARFYFLPSIQSIFLMKPQVERVYFDDPRLSMTIGGRFFARTIPLIFYGILSALTVTFVLSGIPQLMWLSILMMFFLLDRWYHRKEGEIVVKIIGVSKSINVSGCLSPSAWSSIESAIDVHILGGGDLQLRIIKNLIRKEEMQSILESAQIEKFEIEAKLDNYIKKSVGAGNWGNVGRENVGLMVRNSYFEALHSESDFIEPQHLFFALKKMGGNEFVNKLFGLFLFDESKINGKKDVPT